MQNVLSSIVMYYCTIMAIYLNHIPTKVITCINPFIQYRRNIEECISADNQNARKDIRFDINLVLTS